MDTVVNMQQAVLKRPRQVNRALFLISLNLFFGAIIFASGMSTVSESDAPIVATFGMLALAFPGLLIYKMSQGRNWARNTYPALIGITLANNLGPILEEIVRGTVDGMVSIGQFILIGFALYNLFCQESNRWFASMQAKKKLL